MNSYFIPFILFFFGFMDLGERQRKKKPKKNEKRTVKIIYRADRIDTCGQVRELAAGH